MYKKLIIVIILLYVSLKYNPLFSQKDTSQYFNKTLSNNNFSLELGGSGYLYSLGYERIIYKSKKILLTGNIKFSYYPPFTENKTGLDGLMLPIGLNTLIGQSKNKICLGVGASNYFDLGGPKNIYDNYQHYKLLFVPCLGYRRYFRNDHSLSIVFTPFFEVSPWIADFPWLGVNYNINF